MNISNKLHNIFHHTLSMFLHYCNGSGELVIGVPDCYIRSIITT